MILNGQILLNSLVAAAFGGLMAHAVLPTCRLSRYFDLSIAATVLISGYALSGLSRAAVPLPLAFVLAVLISAGLHTAIKASLPGWLLPQRGGSSLLLISFGVYVCLISLLSLIFGYELIPPPYRQAGVIWQLPFGRITSAQSAAIVFAVVLPSVYWVGLRSTRLGRAIRAVGSDPDLARSAGIKLRNVALTAVFLSGLAAALAGSCLCLDVGVRPTLGLQPILVGVVAVVVGIRGDILGVSLTAGAIAVLQNIAAANLGPQWQDVITFGVLVVFLLLRETLTRTVMHQAQGDDRR